MDTLRNAATACIVILNGYTFAPYPLQYPKWLHLERETGQGATYRQVLANVALKVERCIRMGTNFDIAVDDPKFTAAGHEDLFDKSGWRLPHCLLCSILICRQEVPAVPTTTVRLPEKTRATLWELPSET